MSMLGVVMAGGRNTRYGGLKAMAEVGTERIIDRVINALRSVTDDVVIIANDADAYATLGLPMRADDDATGAALVGLLTALRWSAERGHDGIATVACDMPFANAALLQHMVRVAETEQAAVVVPESGGRRGVEPLCAVYTTNAIAAIEGSIARGDLRMIGFHDGVSVQRVAIEDVQRFGEPETIFMNVNTPAELEAARAVAQEQQL